MTLREVLLSLQKKLPGSLLSSDNAGGDGPRPLLALYLTICIAFFVWAAFGELGVVSIATGEVVPASQVKAVQHLEGGIVREILVHEGEQVKTGQSLIVMESTTSGADVIELKARITSLRIELARLEAGATNADTPDFPPEMVRDNADLITQALHLFESQRADLLNEVTTQKAIIAQRRQDIEEITARLSSRRQTLAFINEQIDISKVLLKKNLTNRYNHLDLLKEKSKLEGGIVEDRVAHDRATSAKKEAEARLATINSTFISDTRKQMDAARRELDEMSPRLAKFEDSLKRTVISSPVEGVIKILHVVTIGGVVQPGGSVVDIVPFGDRLVIEAELPPQDIGYVRSGQTAMIALASAGAARFDNLSGVVDSVSPDTILTPEGKPFYRVRIETARDHFARGNTRYDLFPGMQVVAYINTGNRTILEFIIDPLVKSGDIALRER